MRKERLRDRPAVRELPRVAGPRRGLVAQKRAARRPAALDSRRARCSFEGARSWLLAFGRAARRPAATGAEPTTTTAPPVAAPPAKPARAADPGAQPRRRRSRPARPTSTRAASAGARRSRRRARPACSTSISATAWAPFILQDGEGDGREAERLPRDVRRAGQRRAGRGRRSRRARASTTTSRCSASRRRCRCWRRASRRTSRPRARPASTPSIARAWSSGPATSATWIAIASSREYEQALHDADWVDKAIARARPTPRWRRARAARRGAGGAARRSEAARARRSLPRGQARVRAVRALQARLLCEGLLTARSRFTPGMYDLPTHEALATWERKHDIFGWGFLGGETLGMLLRPPRALLAGRVQARPRRAGRRRGRHRRGRLDQHAPRARTRPPGATRDGVVAPGARSDRRSRQRAAGRDRRRDARGHDRVPARAQGRRSPGCTSRSRRRRCPRTTRPTRARRTWTCPREIDRGDIWYDVPFDARGKPIVQRRDHYPHLTLFVHWHGQKIPLVLVADDDRLVAQRDARRRPRLHEVQELRHRAARLEADRRDAGLDPARRHAGEGSADAQGAGPQRRAGHGRQHRRDGPGLPVGLRAGDGHPHRSQARRLRQPDPHARLGRLHVDRAPLLARLPPPGEQPRRAPVRLRAAPPALPAHRRRAAEPQEALRGRRRDLPLRAQDARLLLRAGRADRRSTCSKGGSWAR